MRFVPEELILGILSRVPTRSVRRLRLVCKSWDKLITDPFFARIHSRAPISGFFTAKSVGNYYSHDADDEHVVPSYTSFTGDGGGGIPPMAMTLLSEGFVADASCNGLICFRKDSRLIICDPITETFVTIDDSTKHLRHPTRSTVLDVQLLYDPKVSADFKIVKLWHLRRPLNLVLFHVFSSRDGFWRAMSKHAPYSVHYPEYVASSSVGEEGAVCWLEKDGCALRVYDIGADSLWEMQTPPLDRRDRNRFTLMRSVSGGRVYLMRELRKKFVLWRLEGKEKRWVLEFEGIKRVLMEIPPVFTSRIYPLAYDAEEQKLIMGGRNDTVESYHLPSLKREVIARGVHLTTTVWIVPHWNKPAPFRIPTGASIQSRRIYSRR